ncbi:MAG: electron transfer flavoprotein subunit alpha/FixB family protein [Nitrososphaerota archaeon]
MSKVWIFSEDIPSAFTVTKIASEAAKALDSGLKLIIPSTQNELLAECVGFSEIVLLRGLENALSYDYAIAISKLINEDRPKIVIMPAVKMCREVAAATAILTNSIYATDVSRIFVNAETKEVKYVRAILGGGVYATYKVKTETLIATHKSFAPYKLEGVKEPPKITTLEFYETYSTIKRIRIETIKKTGVDLTKARIIVAVGRGLKKKEDLALIRELAQLLGGEIGSTRVLTEDYGWLPKEHQVGLTGVIVAPNLYIAIGISGQIQHVIGFKEARIVVSINKDKDAPIHQVADYVIIGDLYEIVPVLIKKLREKSSFSLSTHS